MPNTYIAKLIFSLVLLVVSFLNFSCNTTRKAEKLIPQNVFHIEGYYETVNKAELEEAVELLTRRIKRKPFDQKALYSRGYCYNLLKEYEKAIIDFDKAITKKPSAKLYLARGKAHRSLSNYDLALNDLEYAGKLNPDNCLIDFEMGHTYLDKKDYQNAINSFLNALMVERDKKAFEFNVLCFINIGDCYYKLKEYDKALDFYFYAEIRTPYLAPIYQKAGNVYVDMEEFEQAIECYSIAIMLDPDFYIAFYNRGNVFFNTKYFVEAIHDYENAMQLTSDYNQLVIIYCNLSRLRIHLGDYQGSIEYGEKALAYAEYVDIGIFGPIARYNMAISYLKLSKIENAVLLYSSVFEDGNFRESRFASQVYSDLIDHYRQGHDQEIVKTIFFEIIGFTEEEFINCLNDIN